MLSTWTSYFHNQLEQILDELKRYVEMETPTHNKEAVDRLGLFIKDRFASLGCRIESIPQTQYGNQLRVEYGEGAEQMLTRIALLVRLFTTL